MATRSSCAAVLGTAELCGYLMGFLHEPKDLRSCALVSHIFAFPAQSHLFHSIDIPVSHTGSVEDDPSFRLSKMLDEAPHLRPLIRRVSTLFDSDILTNICNMALPRLNWLELLSLGSFSILDLRAAQDVLALSTIHSLLIDASFPTRAALNLIFARCSPALRTLNLRYVNITGGTDAGPISPAAAVFRQRPQIKDLHLLRTTKAVGAWFLEPDCPLDFSSLKHVDVYMSSSPELAEVLQTASPTIEELRVHARDVKDGLSLAHFSALTQLRLVGELPSFADALSSLPAQPRLRLLMIASRDFASYADRQPHRLTAIDSIVAAVHLPVLNCVELSVLPSPDVHDVATSSRPTDLIEKTRTALERAFPQMHSRGVLVVRDYRENSSS